MKEINPEHIKELLREINRAPYLQLLSVLAKDIGPRYSRLSANISDKHSNPLGGVACGLYASLIDTAAYWALYCELDENMGMLTVDCNVNYFAATKSTSLIIEGISIKHGHRVCLGEAIVKDEGGKLLAHGTCKLLVGEEFPSVSQSILRKGHSALPDKFI